MKVLIVTNGTFHNHLKESQDLPAYHIYWGRHYQQILKCVDFLKGKSYNVDYYILSMSHGLVDYREKIHQEKYDWRSWGKKKLEEFGRERQYSKYFYELIKNYQVVYLLLSKDFLYLLNLKGFNYVFNESIKLIFILGSGSYNLVPDYENIEKIIAGPTEAAKYKINMLELKSYLLGSIIKELV
ncbi:MAG: hypothetical protein SCK28_02940 [Bacillota bacterium]|nr:hypothetical protein [Bacillota bacterium]